MSRLQKLLDEKLDVNQESSMIEDYVRREAKKEKIKLVFIQVVGILVGLASRTIIPLQENQYTQVEVLRKIDVDTLLTLTTLKSIVKAYEVLWVLQKQNLAISDLYRCAIDIAEYIESNGEYYTSTSNILRESHQHKGPTSPGKETTAIDVWNIWMEGYSAGDGCEASAQFNGVFKGDTFKDACLAWYETLPEDSKGYYNVNANTFKGRKLHDNEVDARSAWVR